MSPYPELISDLRAEIDRLQSEVDRQRGYIDALWVILRRVAPEYLKIRESTPDESTCSCGAVSILNDEVVEYAGFMHLVDGPCFPLMNADGRWRAPDEVGFTTIAAHIPMSQQFLDTLRAEACAPDEVNEPC